MLLYLAMLILPALVIGLFLLLRCGNAVSPSL